MTPYRDEEPEATSTPDESHPKSILWCPILLVYAMLAIWGFANMVALGPQTRIYEDITCRQYYARHPELGFNLDKGPPDESLCKDPAIQDAVNEIFGWQTFFDGIPGLLLAMYYGALADAKGRRPVLLLSLVGQLMAVTWVLFICWIEVDLRWTWLSSVPTLVGGGSTVTAAALMMIIADSSSNAMRSRVFFYTYTCLIAGQILGPPIGAILMERSPWIPFVGGFVCTGLGACLALFVPETLNRGGRLGKGYKRPGTEGEDNGNLERDDADDLENPVTMFKQAFGTLRFVYQHRALLILIGAYFTVDFARETTDLLVRYASTRFSIPISQASYLFSYRAAGYLLAYAVILPLLDALLVKIFAGHAREKDLYLLRASIVFATLGYALLVLAPNMTGLVIGLSVYTLGAGFTTSIKALLSSLVDQSMIGTIYTTLSLMDTTGALIAGPIDALVMKRAMRLEGIWKGLPFMLAFILCGLATVALVFVDVQSPIAGTAAEEERRPLLDDDIDDR